MGGQTQGIGHQQEQRGSHVSTGVFSAPAAAVIVIGFACFLTAGMVELNPSMTSGALNQTASILESLTWPRLAVTVAGLVGICLLGLRHGTLYTRPALVLGLNSAYALGVLLTYTCGYGPVLREAGLVAGSLLTAGSILLIPVWFEVLCCENTARVVLYTAGAYALSNAMTLVVTDLSYLPFVATTAAMPLASGVLLVLLRHEPAATAAVPQPPAAQLGAGQALGQVPLKTFFGTAVFGVAILMANSISEQRYSFSTESYTVVAGLAVALTVSIVALTALAVRKHLDFALLYRLMLPVLVTCLLLVMLAESGFQAYEALALGGTWTFYRIVTTAVWCTSAADSLVPPAATVAVAQIVQSVCNKAGSPVIALISELGLGGTVTIAIVVSLVVLASVFLLNEHALRLRGDARNAGASPAADPGALLDACVDTAAERFALSQREQELCRLILEGMPSDEIRAKLVIAPSTFKTHMRNIYAKVDVHSRDELAQRLRELAG